MTACARCVLATHTTACALFVASHAGRPSDAWTEKALRAYINAAAEDQDPVGGAACDKEGSGDAAKKVCLVRQARRVWTAVAHQVAIEEAAAARRAMLRPLSEAEITAAVDSAFAPHG